MALAPGRSWLPSFCFSNPLDPSTPVARESPICVLLELGAGFALNTLTLVKLRPPDWGAQCPSCALREWEMVFSSSVVGFKVRPARGHLAPLSCVSRCPTHSRQPSGWGDSWPNLTPVLTIRSASCLCGSGCLSWAGPGRCRAAFRWPKSPGTFCLSLFLSANSQVWPSWVRCAGNLYPRKECTRIDSSRGGPEPWSVMS